MGAGWKQRYVPNWRNVNTGLDPSKTYTPNQLEGMADAILARDAAESICPCCGCWEEDPAAPEPTCPNGCEPWIRTPSTRRGWHHETGRVLSEFSLHHLRRREIVSDAGTPDPAVESGLYSRSFSNHGRKAGSSGERQRQANPDGHGARTWASKPAFGKRADADD